MRATALSAILLGAGLVLAAGCDSGKGQRSSSKKSSKNTGDKDGNGDRSEDSEDSEDLDPCQPNKSSSDNESQSEDDSEKSDESSLELSRRSGLALADATVPAEVSSIMSQRCASCHNGFPLIPGNFRKPEEVVKRSAEILERVKASPGKGIMPPQPAPALSASDIQTIENWVNGSGGGTSTDSSTSTSTSTDTGTDTSPPSSPDPCASGGDSSSSGTGTGSGEDLSKVDPAEKAACHAEGLAFYRKLTADKPRGQCHEATYPPTYSCDPAGILTAFDDNEQVKEALDKALGRGFFIDDCGNLSGKPAVFLACFHLGDEVCVKPSEVDIANPKNKILVSIISAKF